MNTKNSSFDNSYTFKGIYGDYTINQIDEREVLYYRISILISGLLFSIGLTHWFISGSSQIWIYFVGLSISLGLSLKWIHIYLKLLHQILIFFWIFGFVGFGIVIYHFGLTNIVYGLRENPKWILAIGPLFASLTGIGFKEFFCFRRIEAIGITIFIPISLIGYLTELMNERITFALLALSALLLLIMGIRKFDLPAAADIGDKSVFDFLESERKLKITKP